MSAVFADDSIATNCVDKGMQPIRHSYLLPIHAAAAWCQAIYIIYAIYTTVMQNGSAVIFHPPGKLPFIIT